LKKQEQEKKINPSYLKIKKAIFEWVETIAVALILALIIRQFYFGVFWIPSESMTPTLNVYDRLIVNKYVYHFREPKRLQVVVFKYPLDPKNDFVKRIIGLPGEKLEIKFGKIYINDQLLHEYHTMHEDNSNFGPIEIPEDNYFVMGDNRPNSADSRFWGFVPRKNLHGPAFLKIWPIWELGLIR
jgi:signal peptidase I